MIIVKLNDIFPNGIMPNIGLPSVPHEMPKAYEFLRVLELRLLNICT